MKTTFLYIHLLSWVISSGIRILSINGTHWFQNTCIITTGTLIVHVYLYSLSPPRTTMVQQLIPPTPQPSWPSKCWEAGSQIYWLPVMFASVHTHVMDIVVRAEENNESSCKLWNDKKYEEYFELKHWIWIV